MKTLVELDNGDEINLLPYGIQKEFKTKCLIGNGVIIDPNVLLNDFKALENNGIDYVKKAIISSRCHMVTALHRKIKTKIKENRNDKIWLSSEDVCLAFKPLKMGLRTALLITDTWDSFVETYDRVIKTNEKLF